MTTTRRGLGLLLLVLSVALAGLSVLAPSAQAEWPGPGPRINSGNGSDPALASIGGEPWVAYSEGPQGGESVVLVKWLVAGAWTPVGGPLTASGVSGHAPAIAEVGGEAYVAWNEEGASSDAVRVARWSGSAWVPVGASLLAPGAAVDLAPVSITSVGTAPAVPYVGFAEQPGGAGPVQVHVARYVGGAWERVGGALNTTPARDARAARLVTASGAPVVAFDQVEDAAGTVTARVARWDGATWVPLGGAVGTNGIATTTQGLAVLSGQPVVLHLDGGDGLVPSLELSRWSGSAWVAVGPPLGRTTYRSQGDLAVVNGTPYVVWIYTTDTDYMTSAYFNGTTWVAAGEIPSAGTFGISQPSLADVGGVAHVAWHDWDGTGRLYHSTFVADPVYTDPGFDRAWGRNAIQGDPQDFEICTVAYACQFADGEGGQGGSFFAVTGAAIDPSDGSVWTADEGGSRISKFAADGTFLLTVGKSVGAHTGDPDTGRCEVEADCIEGEQGFLGGQFNAPDGIDVGPNGHVFVAENSNHRVQELDSTGHFIRAWGYGVAGSPAFGVCTVASACTSLVPWPAHPPVATGGVLDMPTGIAVGADGSVYVADTRNFRITEYSTTSSSVAFDRTWGADVDDRGGAGFEICSEAAHCQVGGDLEGQAGAFNAVKGVAVHAGEVFALDGGGNNRVQVFGTDGTWRRAWGKDVVAGNAQTGFEVCDSTATPAQVCKRGVPGSLGGELADLSGGDGYNGIDGIDVSAAGEVYVSDTSQSRVQVYTSAGAFERTFGRDVIDDGASGYEVCAVAASCKAGEAGGFGGEFVQPLGVAVEGDQVVVVDWANRRTQEFREGTSSASYAFSSATYTHAESGTATITVTRSGDTSGTGSVHYATANGTATAGSDYGATSGDLAFSAGQASATFGVAITPDTVDEPDETVGLTLSAPTSGGVLGSPSTATLTILDDDLPLPPVLDTVIDDGPTGVTYVSNPSFTFHATVAGAGFECQVDGGGFTPCTVPYVAPVLAAGPHSFDVRASAGGQVDQTPAHRDFSIGGAQTVSGDCSISPYAVKSAASTDLCRIGGHLVQCSGSYHCVPKDMDCPAGSRCTMTTTATWRDEDTKASWTVLARSRHFADRETNKHELTCATGGRGRCSVTVVDSGVVPLGAQPATADWANSVCYATTTKSRETVYRSADDRRIDCHGVLEFEPSQAVQPVPAGTAVQVLAPGAGTLTLSPTGSARVSARGKKPKPTFATVTQTVGAGGVATFTPKLSKKLKKKLKRGKKVGLTVYSTYRSPGGTVVRSSARVTLQKSAKVKHSISARVATVRLPSLF